MVRDMTTGKPVKLIFSFFVSMAAGTLLQQVYNIADSVIVGRFVGSDAFAAVGATGTISFLFIGLLSGACTGSTIPVSNFFGAKQYKNMRKSVANAVYFVLIVSAFLTAVPLLLMDQILTLTRFPADTYVYAKQYLMFTFIGTVCLAFYNLTASLLRAVGDSRTPLISLALSCVLNIGLNLLFVKMGLAVIGVALATAIAQLISAVFCIVYIRVRMPILFPRKSEWKPNGALFRRVVVNGLPMGLQMSVIGIGTLTRQSVMNSLGTTYMTAATMGGKTFNAFAAIMESAGIAMVTYCSQNLGAKKIDRLKSGERAAWIVMLGTIVLAVVGMAVLGGPISSIFISADEPRYGEIMELCEFELRYFSLFLPFLGSIYVYRNSLQGLGFGGAAMLGGVAELVMRIVVSLALVKPFGFKGVISADPAAWMGAGILLFIAYRVKIRKIYRDAEALSGGAPAPAKPGK